MSYSSQHHSARSAKSRGRRAVRSAIETLETRTLMTTVTYTVQTNSDTVASIVTPSGLDQYNANTLRAAINSANNSSFPAVIQFNAAKFPGGASNTITLTSGLSLGPIAPAGTHSYKIVGPTAKPIVVSGANLYTDFTTAPGISAEFDTLTIAHGNSLGSNGGGINAAGPLTLVGDTLASDTATTGNGGGVSSTTGQVTVTNSIFTGDSATDGGGIYLDDTTSAVAPTITASTFTSDTASSDGGAIANFANVNSTLTVSGSNFTNDSTSTGDKGGGAIYSYSNLGTVSTSVTTSTFSGDTTPEKGGAIYSSYAAAGGDSKSLTLTTDTFTGDKSTGDAGGAVYSLDNALTSSGSSFSNDVAFKFGGGIYFAGGGSSPTLTVTNSAFTNDSTLDNSNTDGYGGAICDGGAMLNSIFTITGSTFTNNKAADFGGAVYSQGDLTGGSGSSMSLSADTFTGNSATTGDGGGVDSYDDTLTITASTFSHDSTQDSSNSDGFGGGVNTFAVTLTASNDVFTNDSAAADGGGLFLEGGGGAGGAGTVTHSTFTGDSTTTFDGGGLASESTQLTVSASTFANDTSARYGGGLYSTDVTLNVDGTAFTSDTGDFDGGGIYYDGASGTANVTNSTFTNDLVPNNDEGGAIYGSSNATTLNVANDDFTGNSAGFDGGAIVFYGAALNVSQSNFDHNASTTSGGGAIETDATTLDVFDSTFNGNSTGDLGGGGVNFNGAGNANLANDTFFGNSAGGNSVGGGGLYINSSGTVTVTDSTFDGNTAGFALGGGIQNDATGGADVILDGDIVAGNYVTGTPSTYTDLAGAFDVTSTDDLIGDGSGQTGFTAGNVGGNFVGTDFAPIDPQLGALADNGGPTETQIPASTSLAIGNSQDFPVLDANGNDVTLTDQTTLNTRPQSQGYDIGAYQTGGAPVVTSSVSVGSASVKVPSTGTTTIAFPVTLSAATSSAITLTYSTVGGSASSAYGDYTGVVNGTYTIPAGSAAGTYFITVTGVKYETAHGSYPKTFQLHISSATNATISNATATGTITHAASSSPTVSIASPATVHVPSSGTTTVKVPVTLSATAASAITLTYRTIGVSASSENGDYSGVTSATLTIPAGSHAGTYYITIFNVKHETAHGAYPKTFQVKLLAATNATVVGGTETVNVTLAFP